MSPSLSKLVPDELSLERFNSQYLQNHSSRGDAILATAQALRILDAPREEVESAVFSALNADVELRLEVRLSLWTVPDEPPTADHTHALQTAVDINSFLLALKSPRVDEYRAG